MAVDGAGNLFIADLNLPYAVKLTPGGVQTKVGSGLGGYSTGIALDAVGDVFIADQANDRVVEVTPAGVQTTVPATGLQQPWGVATDAAGDVFIADGDQTQEITPQVVKVTPSGAQSTIPTTGLSRPYHLAVDAAGDVIIDDSLNSRVVQVSPGGVQTTLVTGLGFPSGVTVDAAGDLFIGDQGNQQVYKVNRSLASVNFGVIGEGYQTSDSPITIQNIGNQSLIGTLAPVSGTGFFEDSNSTCASFTLPAGASCVENFYAFPQNVVGPLNGSAPVSDNSLNGNPTTQTISLSALSYGLPVTVSVTGTGSGSVSSNPSFINCSVVAGVAQPGCSGTINTGYTYSFFESPIAGYTFTGWGGACSSYGTNQICTSVEITGPTVIVANFAPVGGLNTLTVTDAGTGSGTVTDTLDLIACIELNGTVTGTCSAPYSNPTATLTATPSGNSTFVGWGGACASFGTSSTCTVTMSPTVNVTATFVAPGATQPGPLQPITAGIVYGQGGTFTSGTANNGGITANSLILPEGLAIDGSGNLYVADSNNNRVLFYPRGSTTAARVYGQNGSLTSNTPDNGGISATSLSNPVAVTLDSAGNLYVADGGNNRVLFYPAGSTTATRVYGQNGSFTSNNLYTGGVTANSMFQPFAVVVDSTNNVYVSDFGDCRVLFYAAGSTTATQVYGQNGSFTTNTVNNGGISANSLSQPMGLALDSSGDLYVADIFNNRVLFYPNGGTTATQVYGQGGSFTSNSANNGGVSAGSLNWPGALALDAGGDLYVVDRMNNRTLFYPFGSTTATRVYGQLGSFTTTAANNGGISANSFSQPWAVALDKSGNVYVTDYSNNRVLEYGPFGNVNVCPAGVSTPAPCNNTITLSYYAVEQTNFGATQVVTQGATGLDFSLGSGGTCTGIIPAGNFCTVNVTFTPLAPGLRLGAVGLFDNTGNPIASTPIYGVGQGPVAAFSPGAQAPISTGPFTLSHPAGILVDAAGNLFISDTGNQQVLKIAPNGSVTTVGSGFLFPQGMAEDGAGDLFVADNNLNQVVEIPAGCISSACQHYVPNPLNLKSQLGVAVDGAGNLFIGDFLDGKVAEVPANGGPQTIVYNPTGCGNAPGCSDPVDLTVDAAGDLFVADFGLKTVAEVPAGCTVVSCVKTIGTGWSQPDGVAVDAAGDVFVADEGLDEIVEVPAGCTTSACQIVLVSGVNTVAVKVDPTGDLFVDNLSTPQISEVTRSLPPSLSFALTAIGSTSADSPQVGLRSKRRQPAAVGFGWRDLDHELCGNKSLLHLRHIYAIVLAPGASLL